MNSRTLICVIDDDAALRDSLTDLLRAAGHRAACFGNVESFLGSDERRQCGCVITDMQMPDFTGIELVKYIAATTDAPKIILITGHPEEIWRERARHAGAAGFLRKPIDSSMLLDLIERSIAT
jgi:FixJ family two-component response regulator